MLPKMPEFSGADRSLEVEVREDEEQGKKFVEIIDLLLAAGYFRARIKGLSHFDKVVGGMTWCIETCNVDIDVDLLFQENLTIGQKISLTEKIVSVLPKLKCPHALEPHQIQGLDFIHIFPVVQWLVKKAIETREETGNVIRAFSTYKFDKQFTLPEDQSTKCKLEDMVTNYFKIKESHGPQRLYRHHAPFKVRDEGIRVQTTLLEYGRKCGSLELSAEKPKEGERSSSMAKHIEEEENNIQNLMKSMASMNEQESKLSATSVGSIVGLQSGQIQQIASEFAEKQLEILNEGSLERGQGGAEYHKRTMASLSNQLKEKTLDHKKVIQKNDELKSTYEELQLKLKELQGSYRKMIVEIKDLETAGTDADKSMMEELLSLVSMNENLKKQEHEFRGHCKVEMTRLKSSIDELRVSSEEGSSEDDEQRQLIQNQYDAAKQKLQKIRVLLARKNREIATLQRKIDEVPSRAELSQYQKRFLELYNQVAAKHKETKQFYTLYNALEDTRMYLMKEVDLLNSIQDNFTEAMSSSVSKEQFLGQLEQIVDRLQQNKQKLEKKKQEEKMLRDEINDTFLDLVEKQRLYFKTVKEFKEECRKNEILVAKLKEKGK